MQVKSYMDEGASGSKSVPQAVTVTSESGTLRLLQS
jgi:hypothetical protein